MRTATTDAHREAGGRRPGSTARRRRRRDRPERRQTLDEAVSSIGRHPGEGATAGPPPSSPRRARRHGSAARAAPIRTTMVNGEDVLGARRSVPTASVGHGDDERDRSGHRTWSSSEQLATGSREATPQPHPGLHDQNRGRFTPARRCSAPRDRKATTNVRPRSCRPPRATRRLPSGRPAIWILASYWSDQNHGTDANATAAGSPPRAAGRGRLAVLDRVLPSARRRASARRSAR